MSKKFLHSLCNINFSFLLLITSFLEIFFGVPSLIFIILPFITTSILILNIRLMIATLVLGLIICFSIIGLIAFMFNIMTNSKESLDYKRTSHWFQYINYSSMNIFTLLLLAFWHIYNYTSSDDLFLPILENIYRAEMFNYEDFNPNCPKFSPNRSRSTNEIFIDELHQRYLCCGWYGPEDWISDSDSKSNIKKLPFSCCPSLKMINNALNCDQDNPCNLDQEFYFKHNCQEPITYIFKKFDSSNYSTGLLYFLLKIFAFLSYRYSFYKYLNYMHSSKMYTPLPQT